MHTKFVEPLKEFSDLILRNNDNSYNILLNVILLSDDRILFLSVFDSFFSRGFPHSVQKL